MQNASFITTPLVIPSDLKIRMKTPQVSYNL